MIAAFPDSPSVDAGSSLTLNVTADAPSRLYFVRCGARVQTMREYAGTLISGETQRLRFDVPPHWSSGVYIYHAYNVVDDTESERTCLCNNARSVSLMRPGGGIGGHTWDERNVDVYDPASPRQAADGVRRAKIPALDLRPLQSHRR